MNGIIDSTPVWAFAASANDIRCAYPRRSVSNRGRAR
jgi:hypothetical protein